MCLTQLIQQVSSLWLMHWIMQENRLIPNQRSSKKYHANLPNSYSRPHTIQRILGLEWLDSTPCCRSTRSLCLSSFSEQAGYQESDIVYYICSLARGRTNGFSRRSRKSAQCSSPQKIHLFIACIESLWKCLWVVVQAGMNCAAPYMCMVSCPSVVLEICTIFV